MLRPIFRTQITRAVAYRPARLVSVARPYSILDTAKQKLDELNHKVGQVAADTIDTAQTATENVKEKVNTEDIKQAASETYESVKTKANETAADVRDKASDAGDVVDQVKENVDGSDLGETAAKNIDNIQENYDEAKHEAKQAVEDMKHDAKQAFEDVKHNAKKNM